MTRLLPLLLFACAPEVASAPAADTAAIYKRGCGRVRCATVRETCAGPQGQVCLCVTVTCEDRCSTTTVGGDPECWTPRPLEVPRG